MNLSLLEILKKEAINHSFEIPKETIGPISAIEKFNSSGEIDQAILPGFDQTGKWVGVWQNPYTKAFEEKLRDYTLPEHRRISINGKGETVLNTSYIETTGSNSIKLSFAHIKGIINLPKTKEFFAPNLQSVGGSVLLGHCKKCDISRLKIVLGPLHLGSLLEVTLPQLHTIQGPANFYSAQKLRLPALKHAQNFTLPHCPNNDKKKIIQGLSLESLKSWNEHNYELSTQELLRDELKRREIITHIRSLSQKERGDEITL